MKRGSMCFGGRAYTTPRGSLWLAMNVNRSLSVTGGKAALFQVYWSWGNQLPIQPTSETSVLALACRPSEHLVALGTLNSLARSPRRRVLGQLG